ncbi:MAG: hypothetical protein MJE66_03890 [Proteobacteria bacterium]|nr:hypothetical protein [Pseudomonadota bacterium]
MAGLRQRLAGVGLRLRNRHVAVDIREDALYWALSTPRRDGLRLHSWGRLPHTPGESIVDLLARLAGERFARGARFEIALRSADLKHRRLDVPPITRRESGKVARRRVEEFAREFSDDVVVDFVRRPGSPVDALWLCAAPTVVPIELQAVCDVLDASVHRMTSHHLALAQLARLLPPPPEGEVTALFDLDPDAGVCVFCDDKGWVFSRLIPLKFAGDRGARRDTGDAVPLAQPSDLADRIATELERTFRYLDSELRLGRVSRLLLSGDDPGLAGLATQLVPTLQTEVALLSEAIEHGPAANLEPGAATAVGAALAWDAQGGNLLPGQARMRRRQHETRRRMLTAAIATATTVALLGGATFLQARWLGRQLAELEESWHATTVQRGRAGESQRARQYAATTSAALAEFDQPAPPWTGLVETLGRLAPPNLAVSALTVVRAEEGWRLELSIEARADNLSDAVATVADFARELGDCPLVAVSEVSREGSRQVEAPGDTRTLVRFRVLGQLAQEDRSARTASPGGRQHG